MWWCGWWGWLAGLTKKNKAARRGWENIDPAGLKCVCLLSRQKCLLSWKLFFLNLVYIEYEDTFIDTRIDYVETFPDTYDGTPNMTVTQDGREVYPQAASYPEVDIVEYS